MRIPHRTKSNPGPDQSASEQKLLNLLSTRFQAAGFGASSEALAKLDGEIATVRAKIEAPRAVRKPSGQPQERDILKAIMQLLYSHPKVAKAWRVNSGTAKYQSGDKTRYVRMNTAKGMSDIMGILKGSGKILALEVKSNSGIVRTHQEEFLQSIRDGGGIAAVVRSVDDVLRILENA